MICFNTPSRKDCVSTILVVFHCYTSYRFGRLGLELGLFGILIELNALWFLRYMTCQSQMMIYSYLFSGAFMMMASP